MEGTFGLLSLATVFVTCAAQFPGFGRCPDKQVMPGFDIDRFLGTWYEVERYFTVLEAGRRCASTTYKKTTDGKIWVSNEHTNRLTGVKRAVDGEIRSIPKVGVDSKFTVKYSTISIPREITYEILDTDYDNYAVLWSCSGVGLVNSQSAWLMARERLPVGVVLQKAYAVLDKYKISKNFFVHSDQEKCDMGDIVPDNLVIPGQFHHPPHEIPTNGPQYQPFKTSKSPVRPVSDIPFRQVDASSVPSSGNDSRIIASPLSPMAQEDHSNLTSQIVSRGDQT